MEGRPLNKDISGVETPEQTRAGSSMARDKKKTLSAGEQSAENFRRTAKEYQADVQKTRERQRQRRLRWILYLNVFILAYLVRRAVEDRPIRLGMPTFGPDAYIWVFLIVIVLLIGVMVAMPLLQGRSPHVRFSPEEIPVHFSDVRGLDEIMEEVTRTLQIFMTYKTFREDLGGNPRRGVLFEGKPGTGKTHMAKAMAAEAGVPFFFVSAPSFHSMWFGMTAWKIRAFFKALKKAARKEGGAIGFIEEMDAVGSSRGGDAYTEDRRRGMSISKIASPGTGGMVNELLVQLQSFDQPPVSRRIRNRFIDFANLFLSAKRQIKKKPAPYHNILIIGATNLAESLDPALMRPGRFDRTLYFDIPSKPGRRDLVDYFLSKRVHDPELDNEEIREELAAMTLGYTPAMLEHIFDEALVWALREGHTAPDWRDIQRARLSEEIGLAQPTAYTDRERALIATHEAGHAVTAYLCARDHRKLEVLSIIKRRKALGLLAHSDTEERFTRTRSELEATIKIAFGGITAEQLFFGESGTGPSNDLLAATTLGAQMIGAFGMGRSLISYDAANHGAHSSANIVAKVLTNEDAKRELDELLEREKSEVTYLLAENRDLVVALRDALLDREELMGDEILAVIEKTLATRV